MITIILNDLECTFNKQGARVIIACRDMKKANEAAEKIIKETGNSQVEVESLDLASFESIRNFCERVKAKLNRLDILINNAGKINLIDFY